MCGNDILHFCMKKLKGPQKFPKMLSSGFRLITEIVPCIKILLMQKSLKTLPKIF